MHLLIDGLSAFRRIGKATHRLLSGGEGMSATPSQFIAATTIGLSVLIGSADPTGADPITAFIFNNIVYEQTNSSAPTTPACYFFSIGATQTAATLTAPRRLILGQDRR